MPKRIVYRSSMPDDHPDLPQNVDEIPQMDLFHEFRPTNIDEIKEIIAESCFKVSPADVMPVQLLRKHC